MWYIVALALKAILVNKVRTFLTMLGVIIGVSSVVLLISLGNGLSEYITAEFDELGASNLIVLPSDIFGENGSISPESSATSLSNSKLNLQQLQEIKKSEYVEEAAAFNFVNDSVSFRNESKSVTVMGTNYIYEIIFNTPTVIGRFFTQQEETGAKDVAVLGFKVAEELFGEIDPIGKKIRIGGKSYTVVGVAEEKGSSFGGPSFDTYIYIPLTTYFNQYDTETIIRMIVKIRSTEELSLAQTQIEGILAEELDDDEFSVIDQSEILNTINDILGIITVALGGIASISLLVGGIGIMNIMLVSVTERTREIGLRKAVGATPTVILLQFLIEAAIISVIGGGIGLLIALGGTILIQQFIPAVITIDSVLLAFGVSTLVGLIFGAAPAKRAADLSPIEALRYE